MNRNHCKEMPFSVIGRVLLAYALICAQCMWAGQNPQAKNTGGSPQKAAAQQTGETQSSPTANVKAQGGDAQWEESETVTHKKLPRDGSHEGVKVHGHWTIEVHNPDGTLVRRLEFENSVEPTIGTKFLPTILAGTQSIGPWAIGLDAPGTNGVTSGAIQGGPCLPDPTGGLAGGAGISSSGSTRCWIVPIGYPTTAFAGNSNFFRTMTVSHSGEQLILYGTATAVENGSIGNVSTWNVTCDMNTSPSACPTGSSGGSIWIFTSATLAPTQVVQVNTGQQIAVTVNISFS